MAAPQQSRPRTAIRLLALILLAGYVSAGATLLLSPDGWGVNRVSVALWSAVTSPLGLQGVISPEQFQALANVALFVPPFAALGVLVPTWWWVPLALLLSSAVEAYQDRLGTRLMEFEDIVANTLGGALGVGIGILIAGRMRRARDAAGPRSSRAGAATAPTTRGAAPPRSAHGPGAGEDDRG